ncbi:MAG: hypothetical protein EOO32_02960 [Comamonadaceae bacterium]|nr:MAG: hypothetical protein EOO32_02960 [Comamonadaceae bacterium]
MNQPVAHVALIAKYRRAEADAAHKLGLISVAGSKGPKAIQTATDTAAKAAKRRDAFAAQLVQLGMDVRE